MSNAHPITPGAAAAEPQVRTIDGVSVRYADSGGACEATLLLTSPWPESIYAFAPMWTTLAEHARLFAVDDRVVPVANAEFLHQRLPNSRLAIIGAGHFVWEEAPAEYASIILDSITGAGP
jgi:pimeloyl-ACP methyl ester carboxylesterase